MEERRARRETALATRHIAGLVYSKTSFWMTHLFLRFFRRLRQARGSLGEAVQKTHQTTIAASAWCWDSSVPTFVSAVATHRGRDRNPASRAQLPGEIIHSQPGGMIWETGLCDQSGTRLCGARQAVQWWRGGRGGGEISASLGVTILQCTVTYLHHHSHPTLCVVTLPPAARPPRAPQTAQLEKTFHE